MADLPLGASFGGHVSAETAAAYAAGHLSDAELELVEEHIDACVPCRRMLSDAARLAAASNMSVGSAPTVPVQEPDDAQLLPPGTVVSRYVVDEPLGSGGMGVVYAAHDPALGRRVALKAIRPDLAVHGQPAEELLRREAMAMARLVHPHVVGVHDLFSAEGTLFVAMDLVEGTTLRGWLHEQPRTVREIVEVFVQAGRGLAAAHAEGIVHRDFKLDNVLCGSGGRVCVSDFGLARILEARDAAPPSSASIRAQAQTGVAGTPLYMAPEQQQGRAATALSDQYSFCVSLYEALYGVLPPSTESAREREASEVARARREVSSRVRRVLARGLRAKPADRYPSMNALLEDLTHDPSARRRQRLAFGAALAAVVGAGLFVHQRQASLDAQACRGGEDKLAGIWDAPRKDAIERQFVASGRPFARDAWRAVRDSVDAWTDGWVSARADACVATRVRREQSEELLDLRMRCMDRRLAELRALGDQFARADGDLVERAAQAAHGLTPPDECTAARVSRTGPDARRPDDPKAAEALGRAAALRLAGKYGDAQAAAAAALADARAAGRPDQEARASYLLGSIAASALRWSDAEPLLFDALTAAEREGADDVAADSAVALADALGASQRRDEAERWLRLASATIDRVGGSAALEARVAHTRARILYAAGRFADAADEQERGLELEESLPPDALRTGESLNTLAGALRDLGKFDRAEEIELRVLGIYEQVYGPSHPRAGTALFNLGLIAMDRGQYEASRDYHARALATAEHLGAAAPLIAIRASGLGYALTMLGRYDEAHQALDRAVGIARTATSLSADRVARIYVNAGQLARREKRWDEAERLFRQAVDVSPDGPHERPDALLGLGRVLLARGEVQAAIAPLSQSIAAHDKSTWAGERGECRLALAVAYVQAGDVTRARALAAEARAVYDAAPWREGEVRDLEQWLRAHGVTDI